MQLQFITKSRSEKKETRSDLLQVNEKTTHFSIKKEIPKSQNADWTAIYEGLESEIKLRHSSPKTTMIHTPTVQGRTIKEAASPLDFS
jgi:hypothetical protein